MGFGCMSPRLQKLFLKFTSGNVAQAIFGIALGRCTFFAIAFSIAGVYGWLKLNRDLTSFALFSGSIQVLLVAHSVKEDHFANQQTTVTDTSDPNSTVTTTENS